MTAIRRPARPRDPLAIAEFSESAKQVALAIQKHQIVGAVLLHGAEYRAAVGRKVRTEGAHPAGELFFLAAFEIIAEEIAEAGAIPAPLNAGVVEHAAVAVPGDLAADIALEQLFLAGGSVIEPEVGHAEIVTGLAAAVGQFSAVRRPGREGIADAPGGEDLPLDAMRIDHRQALAVIAPHLLLPLFIERFATHARGRLEGALGREGQRPGEAVRKLLQGLLTVPADDVADQGIAHVIGALVAKAVFAKHSHLIVGELLSGHNRRADEHVAVAVPKIVLQAGCLDLRHPLRHPHRHHSHGEGIGGDDVGVSVEDIIALFRFIAESLQIKSRDLARQFTRRPERDHVGKLMGHHIAQPVVGAAQDKGHLRGPDLHLVVVIKSGAVGVVVMILDDKVDGAVRTVVVKAGDRRVDLLGHFGNHPGGALGAFVKMDLKMAGLEGEPLQFGMIDRLFLGKKQGGEEQDQ